MGIKNLTKLLQRFAPNSIKYIDISSLSNKTFAIDANLMIYKSLYAIRKSMGKDIIRNEKAVTHIYTMFFKLAGFKQHNINPIFVFDGVPQKIKHKSLAKRKKQWKLMNEKFINAKTDEEKKRYFYGSKGVTQREYDDIKKLILLFGFQYIDAPEEADAQCAILNKTKKVHGVISDDLDVLLFGGVNIIKDFTIAKATRKDMKLINIKEVLNGLKITFDQFVELSILLGTDYLEPIEGIGTIGAYELLKEYDSIDNMIADKLIPKNYDYESVKEYVENSITIDYRVVKDKDINMDGLKEFMIENGLMENKLITKYLDLLKNCVS